MVQQPSPPFPLRSPLLWTRVRPRCAFLLPSAAPSVPVEAAIMCGIIFRRSGFLLKSVQCSLAFLFFVCGALCSAFQALFLRVSRVPRSYNTVIYGADKKAFCFFRDVIVFPLLLFNRSFRALSPLPARLGVVVFFFNPSRLLSRRKVTA